MGSTRKFKEIKRKREGNGKYITTFADLKAFTKQVDADEFSDKHFEKAYENFKRPAYQTTKGDQNVFRN